MTILLIVHVSVLQDYFVTLSNRYKQCIIHIQKQVHTDINPLLMRYSIMMRTLSVTLVSAVLMWISGRSGISYGAEIPVNSGGHERANDPVKRETGAHLGFLLP